MTPKPLTLIDIGAAGGFYPRWKKMEGRKVAIDPFAEEHFGVKVLRYAVADYFREETVHVTSKEGCSSFFVPDGQILKEFPQHAPRYQITGGIRVPAWSLDALVMPYDDPVALKIDVQGAEGLVLDGAAETLKRTVLIDVECFVLPVYQNAPLWPETHARLTAIGFSLHRLRRFWWRTSHGIPVIVQVEAVYIRGEVPAELLATYRPSTLRQWYRRGRAAWRESWLPDGYSDPE